MKGQAPVVLLGMMGSGKSTVGPLLAARMGWRFEDSDRLVEERAGKAVTRIFAEDGERHFRELEREVMAELVTRTRTVVAAGGGWAANEVAWAGLPQGVRTVWLRAAPEVLQGRLRSNEDLQARPLLRDEDGDALKTRLSEMLHGRSPYYRRADLVVDTDDKQPADVAGCLEALLKELL